MLIDRDCEGCYTAKFGLALCGSWSPLMADSLALPLLGGLPYM